MAACLWVATALFGLALGLVMASHEMWRDELQAWLLARDSGSLGELWHNTRYEGHPLLWHLVLFVLTRVWASPAAMQVLHWAVATAGAALILHRAPFPRFLRLAVVFSYLPFYEYGVISRNYAATFLCLMLFAFFAAQRRPRLGAVAGAFAANASPMGMVLAPALALGLWARERRRALVPMLLIGAGFLAAVVQCLPPPDYEHSRGWHWGWESDRVGYTVRNFAAALLPLPSNQVHFWNSSALFQTGTHPFRWSHPPDLLASLTIAGFLAGVAWLVWRCRPALVAWLAGSASLLAFAYVKFPGALRHAGFLWVLALVALWMAGPRARLDSIVPVGLVTLAVVVGDLGALVAVRWDAKAAFSGAACAARGLRSQALDHLPRVAGCDFAASGVAAFLPGARIVYPAIGSRGSFVVWNLARLRQDSMSEQELLDAAASVDEGHGVVLLHNRPLVMQETASLRCDLVLQCEPTVVADEAQWIYLCHARPWQSHPCGRVGWLRRRGRRVEPSGSGPDYLLAPHDCQAVLSAPPPPRPTVGAGATHLQPAGQGYPLRSPFPSYVATWRESLVVPASCCPRAIPAALWHAPSTGDPCDVDKRVGDRVSGGEFGRSPQGGSTGAVCRG